jgi:hypothetical protein
MNFRTAVYIIIKDEKYIVEFIKYYLKIGFDYFIILDDNSTIDYISLFDKNKIDKNIYCIHTTKNFKLTNQYIFLHEYKSSFFVSNFLYSILINNNIDYVLQVDADEFLFIKDDNTNNDIDNTNNDINKIINKFYPFDSLRINWLIFGSNGLLSNDSDSIIQNFTKCDDKLNQYTKSLTKVSSIDKKELLNGNISAHYLPIYTNSIVKNILNNLVRDNEVLIDIESNEQNIYLAHYVNQDFNSFIKRKILRLDMFKNEVENIDLAKKYLYDNLNEFTEFIRKVYLNEKIDDKYYEIFKIIPKTFIDFLVNFFKRHDFNTIINYNIANKLYR